MPKRTRQQQDRHNETRRKLKKDGKKAIFGMKYIKLKHPEIHDDAFKLYDFLVTLYPGKRDLTQTPGFKKYMENENIKNTMLQPVLDQTPGFKKYMENENIKNTMLQPVLEIPLTAIQTPTTITVPKETTRTEEIPLQLPLSDEETDKMINDLRQDPDLMSFFKDFQLNEITVETEKTTTETTPETSTYAAEIDQIIQDEFKALGNDLPDITDNNDELLW